MKNKEETISKIKSLISETHQNFASMDEKYRLISDGMFSIVKELKEASKTLRTEKLKGILRPYCIFRADKTKKE